MKLQVRGLDVWGNSDDGYEINDVYGVQATIEVPDDATDDVIIAALIIAEILYLGNYEFDDFGGDTIYGNVTDPRDGRPIIEVSQVTDDAK